MLIDIPVHRQHDKWTCLAACIRMCMEAIGECRPEEHWVTAMGLTKRGGTLEQAHAFLSGRGVECELLTATAVDLLDLRLAIASPTILGLRVNGTGALPTYHAVVLVGCVDEDYLVNDPAEGTRVRWKRNELLRALEMAGGWVLTMPAA